MLARTRGGQVGSASSAGCQPTFATSRNTQHQNTNQKNTKAHTHILQQPKHKHRQHLHILRHRQLRTRSRTRRRHARLVRLQHLHKLVEQRVAAVLELVRDRALDALVRKQRRDRDLVCRRE